MFIFRAGTEKQKVYFDYKGQGLQTVEDGLKGLKNSWQIILSKKTDWN